MKTKCSDCGRPVSYLSEVSCVCAAPGYPGALYRCELDAGELPESETSDELDDDALEESERRAFLDSARYLALIHGCEV